MREGEREARNERFSLSRPSLSRFSTQIAANQLFSWKRMEVICDSSIDTSGNKGKNKGGRFFLNIQFRRLVLDPPNLQYLSGDFPRSPQTSSNSQNERQQYQTSRLVSRCQMSGNEVQEGRDPESDLEERHVEGRFDESVRQRWETGFDRLSTSHSKECNDRCKSRICLKTTSNRKLMCQSSENQSFPSSMNGKRNKSV